MSRNARRALRLGAALVLALAAPAAAQETPGSQIALDGSIGDGLGVDFFDEATLTWRIDDALGEYGANGFNLFHSFARFDVPRNHVAEFSASGGAPQHVFARVTGGQDSLIEGTLRSTIPGADVFLLNPAGVLFRGDGAALDVQGSFYASSADAVRFETGPDFPTHLETGLEGFSVAPPVAFGFLADSAAAPVDFEVVDSLHVAPGETLAAVGGDVLVFGTTLSRPQTVVDAPGARVAFVAAGPGVDVPLDPGFDPAALPGDPALGEVRVQGRALVKVDASGGTGAGSIVIRGGRFVAEGSVLQAFEADAPAPTSQLDVAAALQQEGPAPGSGIDVAVTGVADLSGGGSLQTGTSGSADGGALRLRAGSVVLDGVQLGTSSNGSGAGGPLSVEADGSVTLRGGARIASVARREGPGGVLFLRAGGLRLEDGASIQSQTDRSPGGAIDIDVPDGLVVVTDAADSRNGTVIASSTRGLDPGATGGLIDVEAATLSLEQGGQMLSSTRGQAPAGSIVVLADTVRASGRSQGRQGPRPAGIRTSAERGTGPGGSLPGVGGPDSVLGLSVDARVVEVTDGAELGTFTLGEARAGDVVLRASERVLIDGGPTGLAGVLARASADPGDASAQVGPGGAILVETGLFELRDGGQTTASTSGTGGAGNVTARVRELRVSGVSAGGNAAGIFAQTLADELPTAGQGGSISLEVTQDALLERGGRLAVETRNGGDAGVVSVRTGGAFAMRSGARVSALSTTLSTGNSGSIDVVAGGGATLVDSEVSARALGSGEAGTIFMDGGPHLELVRSAVTTEAAGGGGGQITLVADEAVALVDSVVSSSVAVGAGDGGDVVVDPELVLLNRSSILARAFDGDGGNIFITADAFLADERSVLDATSQNGGIDGEIVIQSPEVDVASQVVQLPVDYRGADALMKSACATRRGQVGSFVVAGYGGLPASPDGPLPVALYDVAFAGRTAGGGAAPPPAALPPVRIAGLDCPHQNLEVIR